MIRKLTLCLLATLLCCNLVLATDPEERVKEGIRLFHDNDLEGAGKAFADADVSMPDNLRIAFDRACVCAGLNDTDKAIEYLQKAALSRDAVLAVAAHYNLGAVAAACAETLFGEQPEEAAPEVRQEGLDHLNRAVRHYRNCLDLDDNHEDARYNLELIRLWIKHMEAVWKEKDRQKQREEMDLLQFLEMIENRQLMLLAACRNLAREADTPLRRQALDETSDAQRELADEITPLKEKIDQELQAQMQGAMGMQGGQPGAAQGGAGPGGIPGMDQEQLKQLTQLIEEMKGWADESGAAMQEVADFIPSNPDDAPPRQKDAVDSLRRIFDIVAPYPTVVQKSLQTEQVLVSTTSPLVETPDEAGIVHFDDLSWQQDRVAKLSDVMAFKAKEGLKQLEAEEAQSDPSQPQPAMPGVDPEEAKKQKEGLKKSMEIAVERCPEVHTLAGSAAESLGSEDAARALPDEEEALKILKEIAEPLPKNDEQQQQNEQDQENQDQQEQQKDEQQNQGDQDQEQQKQQELSRQQAEDLLQKAKEREKEGREKEEQARRTLIQPGNVDKDW